MVSLRKGERLGPYVLERRLAIGGMAEIWLAADRPEAAGERRYALKVLLPTLATDQALRTMFLDEVRIGEHLRHPNIVHVVGAHEADGWLFLAMELVEGRDLRRVLSSALKAGVRLPIPVSLQIAGEVARALGYAHSMKSVAGDSLEVVHRDVSPHNVMISRSGEVKLLDFGIARARERVTVTAKGTIKGKLSYMSPEQVKGDPVDARSDIFSLGIILWEMLAARRLFFAGSDFAILQAVAEARVPAIREINAEVPDPLADLLARMLARERELRPASMRDVENGLTRVLFSRYPEHEGTASSLASWVAPFIEDGRKQTGMLKIPEAPPPPPPQARPTLAAGLRGRPGSAERPDEVEGIPTEAIDVGEQLQNMPASPGPPPPETPLSAPTELPEGGEEALPTEIDAPQRPGAPTVALRPRKPSFEDAAAPKTTPVDPGEAVFDTLSDSGELPEEERPRDRRKVPFAIPADPTPADPGPHGPISAPDVRPASFASEPTPVVSPAPSKLTRDRAAAETVEVAAHPRPQPRPAESGPTDVPGDVRDLHIERATDPAPDPPPPRASDRDSTEPSGGRSSIDPWLILALVAAGSLAAVLAAAFIRP